MKDEQQQFQNSRLQQREKRRKTNIILNSLIVIVLLLIVIVSVKIFFADDQKTATTPEEQVESVTAEKNDQQDEKEVAVTDDNGTDENIKDHEKAEKSKKDKDKDKDKEDSDKKNSEDIEDSAVVTEGGNDPDVKKTIVNSEWNPVGTVQTGKHSNNYSGVDWDEMVQALSYGTGIDEGNMTIHYLGNNGENKSVGTVQAKDTKEKYRVYIEWVEKKGWKPTLVEELTE